MPLQVFPRGSCAFCQQMTNTYGANSSHEIILLNSIHLSLSSALGSISDKPNYLAHERDSILLTHSPEIYSISSQADTWLGSLLWLFWVQWMKFSKGSLQSICQFYSISKSVAWTLSLRLIASTQPCKEGLTE